MSPDDASGLTQKAKALAEWYEAENKPGGARKLPGQKVDTSWHDEMVRKANASFRKPAAAKKTGKRARGK